MKKTTIISVATLLLALSGVSFGGTIRHDVQDERYLKYGKEYECVLKLGGTLEEKGKEIKYFGSCTAISEVWVITAGHVVKDAKSTCVFFEGVEIPIQETFMCPDFKGDFGPGDLALCKVKGKIKISHYPKLYGNKDEIGKTCGIAGFGRTGTGLTGSKKEGDVKRAGSNKIEAVSDGAVFCIMNRKNPTELEFLISHGDSGGGLFIDGMLAGVNSSVLSKDGNADSNYGDESCHTRISRYKEWIEETIGK
jgi:hypothetical protein